jgi:hypothetical protein
MTSVSLRCPQCRSTVEVNVGTAAYVYSQILMHVSTCTEDVAKRDALAIDLTDAVTRRPPGVDDRESP